MKDIIEVFSPVGCEEGIREILKNQLRCRFDEIVVDNMGNLIARVGNGSLCIECGMDSVGVMVVSADDSEARFASVGSVKAKDVFEKRIVFGNGACGLVCCDDGKDSENAKVSDLYIKFEGQTANIGDFGMVAPEYSEEDCAYVAYGLKNRVALAAVFEAVESVEELNNVTLLFSAQKRFGGKGLRAFFGANNFDRVITVDGWSGDGCVIVAKDEHVVSNPCLRKELEKVVADKDIDVETVVTDENFYMNFITIACGDPCAAIGVPVVSEHGEPDRVGKADFDTAVKLLAGILKEMV
ncbi:MAG: hypothetical protein IJN96_05810 [Clostridia bacterium]|nr:hypothetical protein [Clostridia bacterium]